MKRVFFLLVGLALLAFGGCVQSEQPLSPLDDPKPDPSLLGQWRSQPPAPREAKKDSDSLDQSTLQVSYDAKGDGQVAVLQQDGTFHRLPMRFFVTRTVKSSFLNLEETGTAAVPLYRFYKYQVPADHKTLQLWSLRAEPFEAVVKERVLKGKVTVDPAGDDPGSGGTYTTLQDTSDKVLGFIVSKPDKEILAEYATLEKVD